MEPTNLLIIIVSIASFFCFGSLVALVSLMRLIFDSHSAILASAQREANTWAKSLKEKTYDFAEITKKASDANLSLGQSIIDFDLKLKDLENRVAMIRMQR